MIVLGINGFKREHDPSAALIIDGKLMGFAEEERFIRVKRASKKYPRNAIKWLLHENNLDIDDIDAFALGWDIPKLKEIEGYTNEFTDHIGDNNYMIQEITGMKRTKKAEVVYVPHHTAHAAASYYASGNDEASVIVIDGYGEDESISCYHGKGADLKLIRQWNKSFSLGCFFEGVSMYCGFTDWDAGKTMGLAAYANGDVLDDFIRWENDELIILNKYKDLESNDITQVWFEQFSKYFGARKPYKKEWLPIYNTYLPADRKEVEYFNPYAASCAQETLVKLMDELIQYTIRETGSKHIVLGGGVALNCAANGRLIKKYGQYYVFPAAGDSGVSFGAAAYVAAQNGDQIEPINSALKGPKYKTDDIETFLLSCGIDFQRTESPAQEAVKYLEDGRILGWFQGRMEMGPRALGARSIIARPIGNPGQDKVNNAKCRELWRPFAPSMLYEEQEKMFDQDVKSRFMLLGLQCSKEAQNVFPEAIHVDNTSRPHTVIEEDGEYYNMLQLLKKETGHGIVLNTSFNGPAEPIVCSPRDALRMFYSSELDVLLLDKFLIRKNGVK